MKSIFLVMVFLLGMVGCVFADGFMVAEYPTGYHPISVLIGSGNVNWHSSSGTVSTERPVTALSVKYHKVRVEIDNGIATTYVDEVFLNDFDVDIEGEYIFPLPEEATVKSFAIYADGKKIEGQVMGKDAARATYEDMVRKMREPALLEYVGKNLFRTKVYPIPAHGQKRIELVYQQVLKYDSGMYTYEYPLDTERFSPKPVKDVVVATTINSNIPIKSVYSVNQQIGLKLEKNRAVATYEEHDVKPDKNYILRYTVSEKDVGLNLLTYRKDNQDGYFMLLVSPGEIETKPIDKDIIFVLDTSGSMQGEKIKQAKEAIKFCINGLNQGDRFNIIDFSTNVNCFDSALITATPLKVQEALDYVNQIKSAGGTNINEALLMAVRMLNDPDRPRMVIFLTDGEPTEGVTDIKNILINVNESNSFRSRIFVFGVGDDVNTKLLDKLAQGGRGLTEYVLPNESIESKVSTFYKKVAEPVLSDIRLTFIGQVKAKELYPTDLPDIFKGSQLVLFGRYENSGLERITLRGRVNGQEKEYAYEVNFAVNDASHDSIPRLWATRKIGYLMSEIRFNGENQRLKSEIESLGKEFGIITEYTSFIIDAKNTTSVHRNSNSTWGSLRDIDSRADYYASVKGYSRGVSRIATLSMGAEGIYAGGGSVLADTGAQAVLFAKNIGNMQALESLGGFKADLKVKHIADKVFYIREDGAWVDSAFKKEMKIIEVKYLSPEYLTLLRTIPELAKYFSIGSHLIVVFQGKCYYVKG